jgi:hypothetical protein
VFEVCIVTICNNVLKSPKVFKKNAVIHDTKEKRKKEYWKMADGINRIGGGSYGYVGFGPQKKQEEATQNAMAQQSAVNYEETQVDPSKVMDFMANNIFVNAPKTMQAELDAETKDRIGDYMAQFENYYALIVDEFGEENAPMVMDLVMDKLMGLAA